MATATSLRTGRPLPAVDHSSSTELLRFLVTEYQTCSETGVLLTLDEAVAIEAEDRSTGKRATHLLSAEVFERVWLPKIAAMPFLPDVAITVHDGRELFGGLA